MHVLRLRFPGGLVVENPPTNAGDTGDLGSIPGWGRFLGGGNGSPLQCYRLGNPVDRGAWRAAVPGVVKESDTTQRLNNDNKDAWRGLPGGIGSPIGGGRQVRNP